MNTHSTSHPMMNNPSLFPQLRNKEGYFVSPLLVNIVLEVLARITGPEQEIKVPRLAGGKVSLFTDDIILHVKNPRVHTRTRTHAHTYAHTAMRNNKPIQQSSRI